MAVKSKPNKQNYSYDSIETGVNEVGKQVSTLSKDALRSIWEDFIKASAKQTLPEQLLNVKSEKKGLQSHEAILQEGQEFSLIQEKSEKKAVVASEHREYFRSLDPIEAPRAQEVEKRQQVALQMEIKKLIKASKEMEIAFKQVSQQVTVDSKSGSPSTYEINFLEFVLMTVRNARVRVEEGKNWLALFASKKGQKQYWNQFAKKGTSFSMSSERSTATQTG